MQFTSLHFVFFLIIVLLIITILINRKHQQYFLLGASLYFYLISGHLYVFLLLIAIAVSFLFGDLIYKSRSQIHRKAYLFISSAILLGILGYYKYFNFGISTINSINSILFYDIIPLETLNIVLPVGISFFTFMALSYLFDIYRKDMVPTTSLREYALFISFFPHLVAGPIVRAAELIPQLKQTIEITYGSLRRGTTLIVWGFFKKVVIADNIAQFINPIFTNPIGESSFVIIGATFLFGIQIFCDFSGYTDIAIGIAKIMNIDFPINFNRPYLSQNPTEFWRRWHMSLSRFIRDYLYIPLGGNRKGIARTYVNLMVTWLVCGLWHGAAWNFIAWGAYHGVLLSIHKYISPLGERFFEKQSPHIGRILFVLSIFITQYFVFVGWLLFRVGDVEKLQYCIYKFFVFDFILTSE